jgi:hypothetical protein
LRSQLTSRERGGLSQINQDAICGALGASGSFLLQPIAGNATAAHREPGAIQYTTMLVFGSGPIPRDAIRQPETLTADAVWLADAGGDRTEGGQPMDEASRDTSLGEQFVTEARQQLDASVGLIRHCLDQLDDSQVWWRPRQDMNSIGNLLLHLAGNLKQRFGSVIGGEPDVRDRFGEFTERKPIPKGDLLRQFEVAARRADEILAGLTPARLAETCRYELLAGTTEKSVLGLVLQTLTHLSGHAQEILHLTRTQMGGSYIFRQPADVPPRLGGSR